MLYLIFQFLMQLSMLYLLTAMFIIIDILLLYSQARGRRVAKLVRQKKDAERIEERRREYEIFKLRQAQVMMAAE